MATVKYRIDGNLLPIDIQMANGDYQILAKTVESPDGDKCVIYDCYCVSLKVGSIYSLFGHPNRQNPLICRTTVV